MQNHKRQHKQLLLGLTLLTVSLLSLAYILVTASPPPPNPYEVMRFDSNTIFWRPNPYVDIKYAEDVYLYALDTNLTNQIKVNETVTMFSISGINASGGTINFTSVSRGAQYTFRWSPNTHYAKSIEGTLTAFTVDPWYASNNTLRAVATGTGSATYRVYWQTMNCSVKILFSNGTMLLAQNYYDNTTKIITVPFTFSSSVTISVFSGYYAPTNDQCSITDMDDTDNLYAQKKWYTIDYDVSDLDGYADINYAEVRLKQGAATRAIFRYDEDTDTFTIQSGSDKWDLDTGSCSATESSTYINMTFKFKPQWDATEEASLEIECYVLDAESKNATDTMQTNYVDVVTNLVVSNFACDDDRGSLGQTIMFTGGVYYASDPGQTTPSEYYPSPPYAEFNEVQVHDASHTLKGTDATIVDGQFSVSFSAESTVGTTTYHPYVDMVDPDYTDGDESPTDTFIADQMDCWSVTENTGDQRINTGGTFELRYKIEYDYDSLTFDSLKGSVAGFVWDSGNGWWDKTVTGSSLVTSTNYDETYVSITDSTYGITAKKDVSGVNIITDRIKVLTVTANKTNPNLGETVELRVTAILEYDSHPIASGDTVTLETLSMTWDSGDSRWETTDSKATPQTVTYDSVTGSEATYDITSVYMNGKSVAVTWGAPPLPPPGANPTFQWFTEGDYLGFLQAVYVTAFVSADLLYVALIMLLTVPLYIRTRSLLLMCILWILLGSLVIVAMPIVSGMAFLLVIFGLAGVLFKTYMRVRG